MNNPAPTNEILSLISKRLAERTDALRAALRDAVGRVESHLAGAPLLSAEEVQALVPTPTRGGDFAALKKCVAAIDDDRSQVNILKLLLEGAREYAPRVAVFVVRGDGLGGWAASGFTGCGTATDERVKNASLPLAADTVLRHVATTSRSFVGGPHQQRQNDTLFEAIGNLDPTEIAAFPLLNKGRVAAVVYADCGNSHDGLPFADAIEVLTRAASMSIDLIPVRGKPTAAPAAAPAAAPHGAAHAPAAAAPAPAAAPRPAAAVAAPAAAARAAAPDLSKLAPEEQKLHEAARRFARLLVSEIKLYNEPKVLDGRKNRDLYTRLKEDIDRSKQMYDQRVNPKIAQSTSYFYDELVHTLAEGDASLLAGFRA